MYLKHKMNRGTGDKDMLNKGEIITVAGGHRGHVGACYDGKREEVLAYEISTKLVSMLNETGYMAYEVSPQGTGYTENSQLKAEVNNANKYPKAKLHLCIHFNASTKHNGTGTETWIYALGGKAEGFAKTICSELSSSLDLSNRGVKISGNNLYVPRATIAPCCLVEICFLDYKSDMAKYSLEKACMALYKGVTGVDYTPLNSSFNSGEIKFRVISGSFDNRTLAKNQQDRLYNNGFESFLNPYEDKTGLKYRVVVGSFKTRELAVKRRDELKNSGFDSFLSLYI